MDLLSFSCVRSNPVKYFESMPVKNDSMWQWIEDIKSLVDNDVKCSLIIHDFILVSVVIVHVSVNCVFKMLVDWFPDDDNGTNPGSV